MVVWCDIYNYFLYVHHLYKAGKNLSKPPATTLLFPLVAVGVSLPLEPFNKGIEEEGAGGGGGAV